MHGMGSDQTPGSLRHRIEVALDQTVRPDLRAEGGDVEVVGVDEDSIVQVRLLGACRGCSGVDFGQLQAIEMALKVEIPEIRFLEPVP